MLRHVVPPYAAFVLTLAALAPLGAQRAPDLPADFFTELRWRSIGPHRASRTRSAAGHARQPFTFYIGVVNGGVWKTTDAGRSWFPIFDEQPTQSIGHVVVAPSDPNIVYVGSGEGLHRPDLSVGDGLYRSNDAGRTWTHLGLRDAQQIARIAVDPRNPNRLFIAAMGHPYGPNRERGIYVSTDGGQTIRPVLQKNENVGGNDVDIDPSNPDVVYANLWEARQGPWENSAWADTGGGIFKSTDGGATWRKLAGGLPDSANQANIVIAPSNPRRLYATVATQTVGIYRSEDAGETWTRITNDARPAGRIGGGDLPVPTVHPTNPDIVFMASTVSWKSTDGGRTWAAFKGSPGGEDYQGIWVNPENPDIILMAADQGGVVTLNGGETWSSWYNQPTAQMYHVAADNAFPYRLCSGQQESGSACVSSRGNYGAISNRDWLPVGVDEYGYVAPDPLNPDIVYGGRNVTRFDRRTGQVSNVSPLGGGRGAPGAGAVAYRQLRTHPVVFSTVDKRALFFGNQFLWKTVDGGATWRQISPDLTRPTHAVPPSVGKYASLPSATSAPASARVIYTIGPSYLDINRIWIGTDDGVIQTTADGGLTWQNVTPPQLGAWWKVFMIDPGHFNVQTAYAAVNTLRLDDMRPHIYRTHDAGKTWTEIVNGMDGAGPANAVREDPVKKGLLYASTERGVYVSFDDGDHWQSLRINLPASSVRDLIVKDDDIAVATHGRGFWILDDITPLRQIDSETPARDAVLFKPTTAWRVRWNTSTDMPWPKEEPVGKNPPDGAPINYYLKSAASGPVTLEILRADGRLVRKYSSTDPATPVPDATSAPVPTYWYREPQRLATSAGLHRFHWDVHYQPLGAGGGGRGGLPINSVPGNGAPAPTTPWASPGTYSVKLTVNGVSYIQPITVKQDPRVRTPAIAMQQVYALTNVAYFGALDAQNAAAEFTALRDRVVAAKNGAPETAIAALSAFEVRMAAVAPPLVAGGGDAAGGGRGGRGGRGGGRGNADGPQVTNPIADASAALAAVMNTLQSADVAPTANQLRAIGVARATATSVTLRWNVVRTTELADLNRKLRAAGVAPIDVR